MGIAWLKEQPARFDYIEHYTPDNIFRAVTAWSMAPIFYKELAREAPEGDLDHIAWIWGGCSFDLDQINELAGILIDSNFIYRLIRSNLIYPDGTYNHGALNQILGRKITNGHLRTGSE